MMEQSLLERIAVSKVDDYLFKSGNNAMASGHVFGGTALGCSIAAAQATVDESRNIHSFHAYFLRPGKNNYPIFYEVDPVRDGRSFSTRRVVAKQNDEVIFITSMSFQVFEKGISHQIDMADVTPPEDLMNMEQLQQLTPDDKMWKNRNDAVFLPFDRRHIFTEDNPFAGQWIRFKQGPVKDANTNTQLLGYISDYALLMAAFAPHGFFKNRHLLQNVASIDHAMWFHEPNVKIDNWLFYQTKSPWSGNARGLAQGSFYTREGTLVASVMQEGLIRLKPDAKIPE